MAYEKQTWDTNSFVNPTRMNHIENGIQANSDNIDTLTQGASDMSTEISGIKQNIVDLQNEVDDLKGGEYIYENIALTVENISANSWSAIKSKVISKSGYTPISVLPINDNPDYVITIFTFTNSGDILFFKSWNTHPSWNLHSPHTFRVLYKKK